MPLPSIADGADVTDTRLPDRWLVRRSFVSLPEPAFKLFVLSMMWSVSNRTDGILFPEDLDYVPCSSGPEVRQVLLDRELWVVQGDAWLIQDFLPTQTSAAQLAANEAYTARERERKALKRATDRAANADGAQDRRADVRKTGEDRRGKDRPGRGVSDLGERARERWASGYDT